MRVPTYLCYFMVYCTYMTIKIITVGNKSSTLNQSIIDDYMKRLPRHIEVLWAYIKHANGDPASSIFQESESILKKCDEKEMIILLDEAGEQMTSPQLSSKLFSSAQNVTLIIGGAYGVSDKLKQRADLIWSLSKLVFPHQLVRVILAEQLYRSYAISVDHPYHHV
jgi:23S rRNA (pseudouridine1915-N3)-methyltransferase